LQHLFYFIAHKTRAAVKVICNKIKQNIYFITAFISWQLWFHV